MTITKDYVNIRQIDLDEGRALFEKATQRELGLSGKEFLAAWDAGKFDRDSDRPEIMRVVMLLPLIRAK